MDYYLGSSIEIGEFGVAHVWFQCYEKGYFENAQDTTSDTNSNPNPNPNQDQQQATTTSTGPAGVVAAVAPIAWMQYLEHSGPLPS